MFRRTKIGCAVATALTAATGPVHAQLEEIVVTATKRQASMQDVAVAIQALTGDNLEELGVSNFDEYVEYLPNVVQAARAPGQSEIYIRGAATEQSNLTVSSVQGSAPSVALYQDEQPVSFGARNLDVYATDLERIEVLPGPQGTLFGSSSQSGTVRLITNKPRIDEFEAGFDTDFGSTKDGESSTSVQAYINLPLTEKLAVRVAGYTDSMGGWIDNIEGTYDTNIEVMNRNQIFGAAVCTGNPAMDAASCGGVRATTVSAENSGLVEDNFNDATYRGARVGARYDFNDDWGLLVQHTSQTLETEGVWDYDPHLAGEQSVQRFAPAENQDQFGLTTWTLNGRIANLDLVYTGGFLDRDVESIIDYTTYTNGGGYQVYYICAGGSYTAQTQCFDPTKRYKDNTDNTRTSHEFRVSTDPDKRWRVTAGVFFDDSETNSEGQFQYDGAVDAGFNVSAAPGTLNGVAVEGVNNPFGRGPTTIFVNDFTRTEEQFAIFGEFGFDITDSVRATIGARNYDLDFELAGSTGSSFGCKGATTPCDGTGFDNRVSQRLEALGAFATNGTPIDDTLLNGISPAAVTLIEQGFANGTFNLEGLGADGVANQDDTIIRASLDWRPTDDVMLFATYSEGFRPQTVNRNAGSPAGNQTGVFQGFLVPAVADTDELENFEIGIKGDFLDRRLRLNATAYFSEITNLQTTRFDPSNVAFLVFIENVGDAEVNGLDADFQWAATDNLTISGAASFVDSELTRLDPQLVGVAVPVGSELPYTAEFSGNLRARYDFEMPGFDARGYVRGGITYTGDRKAGVVGNAFFAEDVTRDVFGVSGTGLQIEAEGGSFGNLIDPSTGQTFLNGRYVQESYSLLNLAVGVQKDSWSAELYINNVADENAQIFITTQDYHPKVTTNRPRTIGLRFSYDFE